MIILVVVVVVVDAVLFSLSRDEQSVNWC